MDAAHEGQNTISRRNFLVLSCAGLLGLIWPKHKAKFRLSLPDQFGRIIAPAVKVHQMPLNTSLVVSEYSRDSLVPITHVTIGEGEPDYNRVWYRIGQEGFAHSGMIQPVKTIINEPTSEFPRQGVLAEVTVPFTDAYYQPGKEHGIGYRFYFETTHWIDKLTYDRQGQPWYRVREDKWDLIYFVQAAHLRIIPADELTALAPDVPEDAKRVEVNLEHQTVTAYEWNKPVLMIRAATGAKFSNGTFSTPVGRHMTYHKRPSRHMAYGNLAANGYDLPGVPWVSYITERGVAFHGTYWHNDYGRPRSHGCINLTSQAAKWLYRWSMPLVPPGEIRVYERYGTQVDVIAPPEG
jgi:lipoprotein-anchoring transpeptidase ErfK/SrfK